MNLIDQLNKEFFDQDFSEEQSDIQTLEKYKTIALNYAQMENSIAVLSDLHTKISHIYYGCFAQTLGLAKNQHHDKISSIWEEDIFKLIHPDDLTQKHLHELCFFNFIKKQSLKHRANYYLMSKFRMRTKNNTYIPVLHRMFYIATSLNERNILRLALCLYSPLLFDFPATTLIVNSSNGNMEELKERHSSTLLSSRERQIISFINKGLTSKEIASTLCISVHTVSRHRQKILDKLQVKNSVEACRLAKDLRLI